MIILFAVEYKKKNDNFIHVGNVGLHSIDLIHRRCSTWNNNWRKRNIEEKA